MPIKSPLQCHRYASEKYYPDQNLHHFLITGNVLFCQVLNIQSILGIVLNLEQIRQILFTIMDALVNQNTEGEAKESDVNKNNPMNKANFHLKISLGWIK